MAVFDPLRTLAYPDKMLSMRPPRHVALAAVCFALPSCGPATTVANDTRTTVWVDVVKTGVGRQPHLQAIKPGNSFIGPYRVRDVAGIYVGASPTNVRRYEAAQFCKPKAWGCLIHVSALQVAGS